MPLPFSDPDDASVLLNELKEISNKYSSCNNSKLVTKSTSELEGKENSIDGSHTKNEFLSQIGEKSNLNQYWYSKKTIDALCNAIRECCDLSGGERVAFLSTPSLFFSMMEEERKSCSLFDVSLFFSMSCFCMILTHFHD